MQPVLDECRLAALFNLHRAVGFKSQVRSAALFRSTCSLRKVQTPRIRVTDGLSSFPVASGCGDPVSTSYHGAMTSNGTHSPPYLLRMDDGGQQKDHASVLVVLMFPLSMTNHTSLACSAPRRLTRTLDDSRCSWARSRPLANGVKKGATSRCIADSHPYVDTELGPHLSFNGVPFSSPATRICCRKTPQAPTIIHGEVERPGSKVCPESLRSSGGDPPTNQTSTAAS